MTSASKYAPLPGKIPGTSVNLGGHELVLAPLNLDQLTELSPSIEALGKQDTLAQNIERGLPIIHASLLRNYPEMTLDDVRALVDVGNVGPAFAAIMQGSIADVALGKPHG